MKKETKPTAFLQKPIYPGGQAAISEFVAANMRYPEDAIKAGVQGTVNLRYDIDHKGNVVAAKVLLGIGHGCDEEAIRLVKLLKFSIGKNRGVRAVFHNNINIHFKLNKTKVVTIEAPETPEPATTEQQPMQMQYSVVATTPKPTAVSKPTAPPVITFTIKIN